MAELWLGVLVNILNLPGWEVTGHTQTKTDYRIEAVYTPEPTACPECSTLFDRLYRHGKREQEIRDLPAHGKRVVIALTRKRYRCQGCGRTFLQPLPDVDDRAQMTRRLAEWVGEQSIIRTFTDVANETGLTNVTVRNVFDAYVERLDREHKFWAPTQLGIDEVHLLSQPRCVFTDLQGRTIIGVLAKRDKATVVAALQALHLNEMVEVVSIDMWRGYLEAAKVALPQAAVVIDKFHVVRMANYAVETVRKGIRKGLEAKQRVKMMHDRFVLLRREADLKPEQREKLEAWVKVYPALGEAHRLKETFYGIWDIPQKADAQKAYREWELSIKGTQMTAAYKPLLGAVANWYDQIFAYWDHRVTNAVTEALNGVAKLMERNGRGYSFDVIRAKLLYYYRHLDRVPKPVSSGRRTNNFAGSPVEPPDGVTALRLGVDIDRLLEMLEAEERLRTTSNLPAGKGRPKK